VAEALPTCDTPGCGREIPVGGEGHPEICPTCLAAERQGDAVNHPSHYGGADNPYEAIKVIEAWGLGFCLGNTVKYIAREGKKGAALQDLRKAAWYLNREIERRAKEAA
jgi:hypothetical protein